MLPELQREFFAGLFTDNDGVAGRLLDCAALSARERLAIYRGSVFGILTKALAEIYPVCRRLVGEPFFDALCRTYIPQYPSHSPNLQDYGEPFAAFLAGFEPAQSLPYLPDMARLEWAWHRAFHAADEPGFDFGALAAVSEDQQARIVFRLPVSAQLLCSEYPVHRIWQVNQDDWEGEPAVDLDEGRVRLLVWRKGYAMRIDELDRSAWRLLNAVEGSATLCELLAVDGKAQTAEWLRRYVEDGRIAGFELMPRE